MAEQLERSDAYEKYPDHRITLARQEGRVRVTAGGETLAESDRAIRLEESGHGPVLYIPREDARMERLERTDHHTKCPFKGDAFYFTIHAPDGDRKNAVWSYERPFQQVAEIRDHLAFYPEKVDAIEVED